MSPWNNKERCLFFCINIAHREDAHFYRFTLLHLVNADFVNTFDIALTIGEWCTTDITGGKVFDLVETMLQHITRCELSPIPFP